MKDELITTMENTSCDISDQVRIIYDAVLRLKPPVIIECGVRTGFSSKAILSACVQYGGKLVSFEHDAQWAESKANIIAKHPEFDEIWSYQMGDDIEAGKNWTGDKVGMIFIDTSHEMVQTINELHVFMPLLRDDGEAYFHDTKMYGVAAALMDYLTRHPEYEYRELGGRAGLGRIRRAT